MTCALTVDERSVELHLSFSNGWGNRWYFVSICWKFPLRQYVLEGTSKRHLAKFQ